jgi:hypothetical protein
LEGQAAHDGDAMKQKNLIEISQTKKVDAFDLLRQLARSKAWEQKWTKEEADAVVSLEIAMRTFQINKRHHRASERMQTQAEFACNPENMIADIRARIREGDESFKDVEFWAWIADQFRLIAKQIDKALSTDSQPVDSN